MSNRGSNQHRGGGWLNSHASARHGRIAYGPNRRREGFWTRCESNLILASTQACLNRPCAVQRQIDIRGAGRTRALGNVPSHVSPRTSVRTTSYTRTSPVRLSGRVCTRTFCAGIRTETEHSARWRCQPSVRSHILFRSGSAVPKEQNKKYQQAGYLSSNIGMTLRAPLPFF